VVATMVRLVVAMAEVVSRCQHMQNDLFLYMAATTDAMVNANAPPSVVEIKMAVNTDGSTIATNTIY
jgi:hypothetical protein